MTEHVDTPSGPRGRRGRWHETLSQFDLKVTYVPGPANVVPDALSRWAYPALYSREDVSFHGSLEAKEEVKRMLEKELAEAKMVGLVRLGPPGQGFFGVCGELSPRKSLAAHVHVMRVGEDPPLCDTALPLVVPLPLVEPLCDACPLLQGGHRARDPHGCGVHDQAGCTGRHAEGSAQRYGVAGSVIASDPSGVCDCPVMPAPPSMCPLPLDNGQMVQGVQTRSGRGTQEVVDSPQDSEEEETPPRFQVEHGVGPEGVSLVGRVHMCHL